MKSLYKALTTFTFGIVIFASGCGSIQNQSQNSIKTKVTTIAKAPPQSKQTIWIEYARYTATQVHQSPTYWVLTNNQVDRVGQFLGAIDSSPMDGSGWHSNVLSAGTKFFVIPGTPSTKAFAVETRNGNYLEATLVGSKEPDTSSSSENKSSSTTSSTVSTHTYASVAQAEKAISAIQKELGQFYSSGPNVNLGNGISAEQSGSMAR